MFINKTNDGSNNLCGKNVAAFRRALNISQRELADRLQLAGLDIDKNAVQRIECGKRFVTDIELAVLARVLDRDFESLLDSDSEKPCPQEPLFSVPPAYNEPAP